MLEEISFDADKYAGETFTVTAKYVHEKLDSIVENEDVARYIL